MNGNMYAPNKCFVTLLAIFSAVLLVGCGGNKHKEFSKENHRNAFFPSAKSDAISDYQFYYSTPRGGYLTCARLTLSSNAETFWLQQGFQEVHFAQETQEQQVLLDLLHATVISMFGGTNDIPTWMNAKNDSPYKYLEKTDKFGGQALWWNINQNVIYLTGIGSDNTWITNR